MNGWQPGDAHPPVSHGTVLHEMLGLDEQIQYAETLYRKYNWPTQVEAELEARLHAIRRKQQDPCLNLSVIGEFSSGKSTFINALLRMELLTSRSLQGTTTANTILEDGPRYEVAVHALNGTTNLHSFPRMTEMHQYLSMLSSDNGQGKSLADVTARFPCPQLAQNRLRIIDTPGLNATAAWHAEATIRALREASDLSVILIPADSPLPESLCRFMHAHLEGILPQCVFVLTKFDLLPVKERSRMLVYVRKKLTAEFGIRDAQIFSYSSLDVLRSVQDGQRADPELLQISLESESGILQCLSRQRTLAQTRKLLDLIDMEYQSISGELERMQSDYEADIARLERSRQTDLSAFLSREKQERGKEFLKEARELRSDAAQRCGAEAECASSTIISKLNGKSIQDMEAYLEKQLQEDCKKEAEELWWGVYHHVFREQGLQSRYQGQLSQFERDFRAEFRRLDCLPPAQLRPVSALPSVPAPNPAQFTDVQSRSRKASSKDAVKLIVFVLLGTVLGAAVMSGIGMVLGAIVGAGIGIFLWANHSGKQEKVVRETLASSLRTPLKRYFSETVDEAIANVDRQISLLYEALLIEIDHYYRTYHETVAQKQAELQAQRKVLDAKSQEIMTDLSQIRSRRESLRSARMHLSAQ